MVLCKKVATASLMDDSERFDTSGIHSAQSVMRLSQPRTRSQSKQGCKRYALDVRVQEEERAFGLGRNRCGGTEPVRVQCSMGGARGEASIYGNNLPLVGNSEKLANSIT